MLKVGDFAVHDCSMPYPNTIFRVDEINKNGGFRGTPVFRLVQAKKPWKKITQWYAGDAFRRVLPEELAALAGELQNLLAKEMA
jgi:hypothetical protein